MRTSSNSPLPLRGVIQHYDWGGYNYIPNLLNRRNTARNPAAELWLGAHPKGPADLVGHSATLAQVLQKNPAGYLGNAVSRRFRGRLPFLLKILDVREMLSIQVHPSKEAAEAGFAWEEAHGIPRDAPHRNFRDDNHKPELGVALTDFYLLHGFRTYRAIAMTLNLVPEWGELRPILEQGGVKALYAEIMSASQERVNRLLEPLIKELLDEKPTDLLAPGYWALEAHKRYTNNGNYDRGIFSIFWFNIVHLRPGEGIYQAARLPHAYLRGCCVELMANSDNVLRGGLTPKHIDVTQLLRNTDFEPVRPEILFPQVGTGDWDEYETPAPDFKLTVAEKQQGEDLVVSVEQTPCILFLCSGSLKSSTHQLKLDRHQRAVFLPAGCAVTLHATEDAEVYCAGVNTGLVNGDDKQGHHVSDN